MRAHTHPSKTTMIHMNTVLLASGTAENMCDAGCNIVARTCLCDGRAVSTGQGKEEKDEKAEKPKEEGWDTEVNNNHQQSQLSSIKLHVERRQQQICVLCRPTSAFKQSLHTEVQISFE